MPRSKIREKKTANKYRDDIQNLQLTRDRFDRLSRDDRVAYIDRAVRQRHPQGRSLSGNQLSDGLKPDKEDKRPIGGYYSCYWCGVADVFGGYVSEED